jgi:chromosome segregation ATPase
MAVTPKRSDNGTGHEIEARADATPSISQVLRAVDEASKAGRLGGDEKKDDERISLFWRVFGGTILSIVALVSITLFNNIMSSIAELRSEVSRANEARNAAVAEVRAELAKGAEARADLVRKDEFNSRMTSSWDRLQTLQQQNNTQNATLTSLKTEIDGLKERAVKYTADVDAARKDAAAAVEAVKKDQAATNEAIKKDVAALEVLKEKLVALAADLKAEREDVQKLRQEVARNQAYDLERKERRDAQYKQFDETVKELTKGLQDCREKIARLEGLYAPPTPVGPPTPKK